MPALLELYKNRGLILEGIKNSVFKSEDVEEIARQRLQVCLTCVELDSSGEKCAVPGTQPCCQNCGCSLGFKTRSLAAACPLNKWLAVLSDAEAVALNKTLTS